jgi:hypothetical protein
MPTTLGYWSATEIKSPEICFKTRGTSSVSFQISQAHYAHCAWEHMRAYIYQICHNTIIIIVIIIIIIIHLHLHAAAPAFAAFGASTGGGTAAPSPMAPHARNHSDLDAKIAETPQAAACIDSTISTLLVRARCMMLHA